ncbi:MAG: hypothetical protein NUV63_05435 [Gallionella sp.]|nr:hypothetical protein [Gallionella sp.]
MTKKYRTMERKAGRTNLVASCAGVFIISPLIIQHAFVFVVCFNNAVIATEV